MNRDFMSMSEVMRECDGHYPYVRNLIDTGKLTVDKQNPTIGSFLFKRSRLKEIRALLKKDAAERKQQRRPLVRINQYE